MSIRRKCNCGTIGEIAMLSSTNRTTIKKNPNKAVFETEKLYQIIDESLLAHIAIEQNEQPIVIPMLVWRVDNNIYVHGAKNSRLIRALKMGKSCCLTFTLFDGWVLARSAFHHSAHYRSAMVFGQFDAIDDNQYKNALLNHFIEQIAPGRSECVRQGNEKELTATELLMMPLTEASVKIGCNGVNDDERDMDLSVWAGIIPYKTVIGPLQDDEKMASGIDQPDYSLAYGNRWYK